MIFLQKFRFWENRGMLPHDRDIVYHDRERSFTSRALLGLTVLDNLVCSRSHITTVISYITIVTVLTIDHHDRDSCEAGSGLLTTHPHDRDHVTSSSWPSKFWVSNMFIFGLLLVYFGVYFSIFEALHFWYQSGN